MDFDIPVGKSGDSYDRYLVRIYEMRESNRIIKQCVDWLRKNPGPVIVQNYKVAPPPRSRNLSGVAVSVPALSEGENGVHRLVRISPFDSNAKRHTEPFP